MNDDRKKLNELLEIKSDENVAQSGSIIAKTVGISFLIALVFSFFLNLFPGGRGHISDFEEFLHDDLKIGWKTANQIDMQMKSFLVIFIISGITTFFIFNSPTSSQRRRHEDYEEIEISNQPLKTWLTRVSINDVENVEQCLGLSAHSSDSNIYLGKILSFTGDLDKRMVIIRNDFGKEDTKQINDILISYPYFEGEILPSSITCPYCEREITLKENERNVKKFTCYECNKVVDMTGSNLIKKEKQSD